LSLGKRGRILKKFTSEVYVKKARPKKGEYKWATPYTEWKEKWDKEHMEEDA
jgi:hypothetical protein